MNQPSKSPYTKEFMEAFKNSPNYVHFDDTWRWEIPLPNKAPYIVEEIEGAPEASGIPMDELWELLMSISEDEYAPKNEEAPSISTDPHQWMTDKEIHEEKVTNEQKFLGSRYCSYCDYTPCRCKNEEYGK